MYMKKQKEVVKTKGTKAKECGVCEDPFIKALDHRIVGVTNGLNTVFDRQNVLEDSFNKKLDLVGSEVLRRLMNFNEQLHQSKLHLSHKVSNEELAYFKKRYNQMAVANGVVLGAIVFSATTIANPAFAFLGLVLGCLGFLSYHAGTCVD